MRFGVDRCDAIFLGPDIGFVNVMEYHDDDESCKISMTELASVCSQFLEECLAFLASSEGMPPKCDAIFLGPDIGFVDVFTYHDDDKSCKLNMQELSAVCTQYFAECMSFLESSEGMAPRCDDVYLGPEIGFKNIMIYHDADKTCKLSIQELQAVCTGQFFQTCLDFLASSEQEPECETIFLGPDIGMVQVMEYHDEDGSCKISMAELAAVCVDFFEECLAFLESDAAPRCDKIFLGPDIGLVDVFEYNDQDNSCTLSMAELGAVCTEHFAECMSFLESSEQPPECETVFLGPDIGYANVMSFHDDDGTCKIDMAELGAVCAKFFSECMAFLESSEEVPPKCEQVFLGPDLGYQDVFTFHASLDGGEGQCKLSMTELAAVCSNYFQECMDFLDSSESLPECDPIFLGPDIGFANIFTYHDDSGDCKLSMVELGKVCSGQYFQTCLEFLASSEGKPPRCEQVYLGADIGYVDLYKYHDDDGSCTLSLEELAAVCADHMQDCLDFLESSEQVL